MSPTLTSRLFKIGMFWRALYGLLRLLVGFSLLHLVGTPLVLILQRLMGHELSEDPHDIFFGTLTHLLNLHPLEVTYFLSAYLIFWGVLDLTMSYCLIKEKLWAFPASLVLMTFFTCYEVIRIFHTHSPILLGVIIIDVTIVWLVWREYAQLRAQPPIEQVP